MRKTLSRALLIAVTLFVVVLYYVPIGHVDFLENWGEGTFGLQMQPRSPGIDGVDRGSPAERAGIRPGDRVASIDGSELNRVRSPYPGERDAIPIERDGAVRVVVLTATPVATFGIWQRIGGILALLPATYFLWVAFAMVFLRPSIMMWSFYVFAVGYFGTQPAFEYWTHVLPAPAYGVLQFLLVTVLGAWSVMPLLPFVLRFPNGDISGWRAKVDKFVWILLALALALDVAEWRVVQTTGSLPGWTWLSEVAIPLFTFFLAALIVAKNYAVATPADRQRYGFLMLGSIASFVAYAVYFVPGISFAAGQVVGFAVVLMPLCVAYAVFRLRVLDVNFVLNRALAYGLVSLVVIVFVSILDWLFSRVVSIGRFAVGLELLVTIGVGFLLDRINRVVGGFVEAVFFRHRRAAESYLRRAAAALPYATDEAAISDGLVQVPVDALRLTAAALYRRSSKGTRFEGVATSTEAPVAPPGFETNHLLVRMLLAGEDHIWLDELRTHLEAENAAIYALAVPVTVRHELVSFTLYGVHRNGAQLDPEEVDLLEELAREASRAYDHVEAVRMKQRYGRGDIIPKPA
jgi:PDZ domain